MAGCTSEDRDESEYYEDIDRKIKQLERRVMFLEDRMANHERQSFCAGISDK